MHCIHEPTGTSPMHMPLTNTQVQAVLLVAAILAAAWAVLVKRTPKVYLVDFALSHPPDSWKFPKSVFIPSSSANPVRARRRNQLLSPCHGVLSWEPVQGEQQGRSCQQGLRNRVLHHYRGPPVGIVPQNGADCELNPTGLAVACCHCLLLPAILASGSACAPQLFALQLAACSYASAGFQPQHPIYWAAAGRGTCG